MRKIAVVTVARSDYGILRPVLRLLEARPEVELIVLAAAAHLSPDHGSTIDEIEADGFPVVERIPMPVDSDSGAAASRSMGLGTAAFADAYDRHRPHLVVALGDRIEMHAAVVAAVPLRIPVAHLHGGEVTEGAIDDSLRHSMTKLSHLHFAATEAYARRIEQMGEEAWRVVVSGAPSLDAIRTTPVLPVDRLPTEVRPPFLLVTYHPVTLDEEGERAGLQALVEALDRFPKHRVVITHPNADPGRDRILDALRRFAEGNPRAHLIVSAGSQTYFSLMAHADAMVGNSSSGIIEAPSFGLPVVNIGARQRGRVRGANVIDAHEDTAAVASAIGRALEPEFRRSLTGQPNPYGDGHAAERIVARLCETPVGEALLIKRFRDERP